jgi:hypothetical protein
LPVTLEAASFQRLEFDQPSYTVGARALVLVHTDRLPKERSYEYHFDLALGGERVTMGRLSNRLSVGFSKAFAEEGEKGVTLRTFMQEIQPQRTLAQGRALYDREITRLQRQLDREENPELRPQLERAIAQNRERVAAIDEAMARDRALVGVRTETIPVLPAVEVLANSTFTIAADRSPAVYSLGERAAFKFLPSVDFSGPGGAREALFRYFLDDGEVKEAYGTEAGYAGESPLFTGAHVGERTLTAAYLTRPKAQADLLRSLRNLAWRERAALLQSRDRAPTEGERVYLDVKAAEMGQVFDALVNQLGAIAFPVATDTFPLTVLP